MQASIFLQYRIAVTTHEDIWPFAANLREIRGQLSLGKAAKLVDRDRRS